MIDVTFTVFDHPAPQGSKRFMGRGKTGKGIMIESGHERVTTWREAVKEAAIKAMPPITDLHPFPRGIPVRLGITFMHARPKAHYRTGANSHVLKDGVPTFVTVKPDLSKLIRSTEDALTAAGVWADDAQVAVLVARQLYNANTEGAVIRITEAKAP